MKKNILHILLFVTALFIFPYESIANELIGRWIQQENEQCGYKNIFTFRENDHFELHYSSIIESKYKIENNLLVVTGLTPVVDPPVDKSVYYILKNQMIFQRVISEKPLILSERVEAIRLTDRDSIINDSIVGKWQIVNQDPPTITLEYTSSGVKLFSMNAHSSSGGYLIKDGKLILLPTNKKADIYKISHDNETLTLINSNSKTETYKKIK